MSEDPADPLPSSRPEERRPESYKVFGWDLWRATMFAGSVVLLALAVGAAVMEGRLASWIKNGVTMLGYGLLVAGFALAMRARRKS